MPLILFLLLILVPLSGFIAWAGDKIGHKVGKRRHTLFGLRPRHTATLFTVGAGVGISLATFGLMLLLNASFRTALWEGEHLVTTNRQMRQENKHLAEEQKDLAKQAETARAETKSAQTERDTAEQARSTAQKNLTEAEAVYKVVSSSLTSTRERLTTAEQRLTEARRKLSKAEERVTTAQERYTIAVNRARSAEQNQRVAVEREKTAQRAAKDAEKIAKTATEEQVRIAANAQRDVKNARAFLEEQEANMRKTYDEETKKQSEALARLQDEITFQEKRRDELNKLLRASLTNTAALRQEHITYRIGEEVDRLAIPAGISIWRVQSALDRLLDNAATKAKERGAERDDARREVVLLLSTGEERGKGDSKPMPQSEDEVVRVVSDTIRRGNQDVVVVLTAATNAVVGEPVPISLHTYKNPVVFQEGAKIGDTILDGTQTRQAVADSMYRFLHSDIRQHLLEAGVIPFAVGGNETEINDIVSLTGEQWLKVIEDIRRAGTRARVTVKASKELRAADPVSLDIEVKTLPSPRETPIAANPYYPTPTP